MIKLKTEEDIKILREAGKATAEILHLTAKHIAPGVKTIELDQVAESLIKKLGFKAAFYNYRPSSAFKPYPNSICVSVNEEVVHGIPGERVLKEGDIVTLDMGLIHKGMYTDMAVTFPVGSIDQDSQKLLENTKEALYLAIKEAKVGNTTGDIGHVVESHIKPQGYGIIDVLAGHGVGYGVHEDPFVPNIGKRGEGEKLKSGMILAIEPMINLGKKDVYVTEDGYTIKTVDGKRSAHFEHTVLVTEKGGEILTK